MTILNNKKLPITLKHLTIVDCTLYRPIRSVTLVKSIGSAKPGKARVINFKARVKPKARALEKAGLFSITNYKDQNVETLQAWTQAEKSSNSSSSPLRMPSIV